MKITEIQKLITSIEKQTADLKQVTERRLSNGPHNAITRYSIKKISEDSDELFLQLSQSDISNGRTTYVALTIAQMRELHAYFGELLGIPAADAVEGGK